METSGNAKYRTAVVDESLVAELALIIFPSRSGPLAEFIINCYEVFWRSADLQELTRRHELILQRLLRLSLH